MKFTIVEKENLGPEGKCKCPECDYATDKIVGVECKDITCPNCDIPLIREGGSCD